MTIVEVTATPYAAARLLELRNASTRPMQATIRTQLIEATYTWPTSRGEVWSMSTRGRNPSWTACMVSE